MQDAQDEEYYIVEPNIVDHHVFKITNYKGAIVKSDIIVLQVVHTSVESLEVAEWKVILDFCGVKNKYYLIETKNRIIKT